MYRFRQFSRWLQQFCFVFIWLLLDSTTSSIKIHNHPFCGVSPSFANHRQPKPLFRDARIIAGNEANPGAWPWQVSVELELPALGKIGHWCGGVLIHPNWVLTAAHCVQNKLITKLGSEKWTVTLGSGSRSHMPTSLPVTKIEIHPNFVHYQNDIALLKIPWDPRTMNMAPICLPISESTKNETFMGINCIATGWGQTADEGTLQDNLRQVELKVVENRHCQEMYDMKYNIQVDEDMHLCAGPIMSGGKGTCIGDSGGPLQCNMKDGRWYLAGITSFGSGCAKPGFPDVFSRISHFVDWIEDVISLR